MNENSSDEISPKKEAENPPEWWIKAIKDMPPEDEEAIKKLRDFFAKNTSPQRWYYSGSGPDITPTFIAPFNSEFWMVDPGYDSSSRFHQPSLDRALTEPFQKLGADISLADDWKEAWENKKQTITLNNQTVLQLIGGETQEKETCPAAIDVIYTNPYSTAPGPDSLIALKDKGYYVICKPHDSGSVTLLHNFNPTFEDFGFQKVADIAVENLHFPSIGEMRVTTEGRTASFQVYQKTRPFTPEEEDTIYLNSLLWEINIDFGDFVFRFDPDNFSKGEAAKMEKDLENLFRKYFDRINNLKGSSREIPLEIRSQVENLFPEDESLPKDLEDHYLFEKRDRNKVMRYYQQAKDIYQMVKNR